MAHENLKQFLIGDAGKKFVMDLTLSTYEWADKVPSEFFNYRIFEELTIRYETGQKTRFGLDKNDHYRFDAVFYIQPGRRALNQKQCYNVGVELKNSKADLMGDHKIDKYIGWTDFFFVGVPSALIEDAQKKVNEIYQKDEKLKDLIGVLNVETGEIVSMPKRQDISLENVCKLQEQIIYSIIFSDVKAISFKIDEIESEPFENNSIPSKEVQNKQEWKKDKVSPQYDAEADKKRRQAYAEQKSEQLKQLAKRAEELPFETSQAYNKLDTNAKQVFWGIVDEQGAETNTRTQISESSGVSLQKIDRSLVALTESGLIKREGSKKKGRYVVDMPTDRTATCASCKLKEQCDYKGAETGNCAKFK